MISESQLLPLQLQAVNEVNEGEPSQGWVEDQQGSESSNSIFDSYSPVEWTLQEEVGRFEELKESHINYHFVEEEKSETPSA